MNVNYGIHAFELQFYSCHINNIEFDLLWDLMLQCFQSDCMRTYEGQKRLLAIGNYNINVIKDKNMLIAFMAWWNFSWCTFIEYIGVRPEYRGQSLAETLLTSILHENKLTILEVDNENVKAYMLYSKEGFYVNSFDYSPMDLRHGIRCRHKLKLMSFPRKLTEDEYRQFIIELHKPQYNTESSGIKSMDDERKTLKKKRQKDTV